MIIMRMMRQQFSEKANGKSLFSNIGVILGLYWDNEKENGNYNLGFRV